MPGEGRHLLGDPCKKSRINGRTSRPKEATGNDHVPRAGDGLRPVAVAAAVVVQRPVERRYRTVRIP
jgi:hypothetical protein